MHLKRIRFHGILGPNECGRTTLRRVIANEQQDDDEARERVAT